MLVIWNCPDATGTSLASLLCDMIDDFFTPPQNNCVRAVFDRLIPPDDFPGAWKSGCGDYLASQFTGDLAPQLKTYRAGLDALDAEAQSRHAARFSELNEDWQDELLADLERGQTQTTWPGDARRFFETLLNHCAEGFYADPGNGGNRAKASWQMIGFLDR